MKEGYEREEHCGDHRKGSSRHFQPPKNLGSNFRPCLSFYFARIGVNVRNGDLSSTNQKAAAQGWLSARDAINKSHLIQQAGVEA